MDSTFRQLLKKEKGENVWMWLDWEEVVHSFVKCVTAVYIITLAACSNASQCVYVNFKIGEMYVSQVGNLGELTSDNYLFNQGFNRIVQKLSHVTNWTRH